jgi:methionyl-tRNA formyltransferase
VGQSEDSLAEALFRQHWPERYAGNCERRKQSGAGSFHTLADRDTVADLMTDGWDTPVGKLRGLADRNEAR